jgi:hypothetical protein
VSIYNPYGSTHVIADLQGFVLDPGSTVSLDTTYSGDGIAEIDLGVDTDAAPDEVVRTTTGGFYTLDEASDGTGVIRRFGSNGVLDPGFGAGGSLAVPDFYCGQGACALSVDHSNRPVLSGYGQSIRRYAANGASTEFDLVLDDIRWPVVAVRSDDGLVVTSRQQSAGKIVHRISPAGAVLGSFTYPGVSDSGVLAAAVDNQDRPLLVDYDNSGHPRLSRLNAAVSGFDTTFNGTGSAQLGGDNMYFLATDTQDRVLVGEKWGSSGTVTRYTAVGAVDATFGSGGVAALAKASPSDVVLDLSLMGTGVVGVLRSSTGAAYLSRITGSGAVDAAFGGTGRVDLPAMNLPDRVAFGPVQDWNSRVAGSASLSDVVVAGSVIVSDPKLQKVGAAGFQKVAANGGIDGAFGVSGLLTRRTKPIVWLPLQVSAGGSGSLLMSMMDFYNDGDGFGSGTAVIVRVTSNGTLDTSYGNGGVLVDLDGSSIAVDPSGRVLMFRTSGDEGSFSFPSSSPANRELRRYTAAGVPDTTFAGDGSLNWAEVPAGQSMGCRGQMTVLSDSTTVITYGDLSTTCSTTGFDKVSATGALSANWAPGLSSTLAPFSGGVYSPASLSLWPANGGGVYADYRGGSTSRLLRLTGAGSVDAAFGGATGVDLGGSLEVTGVLADNSVIAKSGASMSFVNAVSGFARFTAGGTRVTSTGGFGADGMYRTSPTSMVVAAGSSILVHADGWISASLSAFDNSASSLANWPSVGAGGATVVPGWYLMAEILGGRVYLVGMGADGGPVQVTRLKGTLP